MLLEGKRGRSMEERKGATTFKGDPLTLLGNQPKVGEKAPDATLLANNLSQERISTYRGKIAVLVAVPSLDTSVCDTEARKFNEKAAELGADVKVLVISMDLPFGQSRWCGAAGVENVETLSDHREGSFGLSYGVLIKELRLLARSIFVVDKEGVLQYCQLVKEMTDEPDYDEVLETVKKLKG
jgi:thiol peroxidase